MADDVNFYITATDKTKAAFGTVEKGLKGITQKAFSTQAKLAGLLGAGGFGAFIAMSARGAKESMAYARAIGESHQELKAWNYAATETGLTQEKLNDIFKDSSEKIGDAYANGAGEALDVLKRLNLSAEEMVRLSPSNQILRIGEALEQVETQSEKIQIMESLASDSSLLLPVIGRFSELREEAIATGAAISDVDAVQLEKANASLDRSMQIVTGVGQRIAVELAPYVNAVAHEFAGAAAEADGWGGTIVEVSETAIKAAAFVADAWRGVKVVYQVLKVAVYGFGAAALSVAESVESRLQSVNDLLNKLPGVHIESSNTIAVAAASARQAFAEEKAEMHRMLMEPMPSAGVEETLRRIKDAAKKASAEVVESRNNMFKTATGIEPTIGAADAERDDKLFEDLEKLREATMLENELLAQKHLDQELIVEEAFQRGFLREQERKVLLEELERQHQAALGDIWAQSAIEREQFENASFHQRSKSLFGFIASTTEGVAQHSRELFEINKMAGTANAVISTYEGIAKAWSYGPILGPPLAALVAYAGFKQVGAIQGASYAGGGRGTTPSAAGSTPTYNSQPVQSAAAQEQQRSGGSSVFQLVVQGNMIADDEYVSERLFPTMRRMLDENDEMLFSPRSRQAMELSNA